LKQVARQAAYQAIGEGMESIEKHIEENPDVDGMVTGDETRLRQIITNLARSVAFFKISTSLLEIERG
jgi:signal transduction histidine kinase